MVKPQIISHPRRILAVSLEDSADQLSQVIKDLTGNNPEPASSSTSLAGTTHNLELQTAYYTATVPVWLDLISTASEWAASFLSPEAKEVLEVMGGVIVVFPISSSTTSSQNKELIREIGKVVKEGLGGWEWDGVGLGIGVGEVPHLDDLDMWDEACGDAGLEFVHIGASATSDDAKNEFGEKMGIPRVLEALESNDWDSFATADDDDLEALGDETTRGADEDGVELNPENLDFGFDREDFEGLKKAIWEASAERESDDGDQKAVGSKPSDLAPVSAQARNTDDGGDELGDEDIQKVEQMMRKLQAVKDMSAGLPEDQKKRMAAKAVGEVMKEL
ncbi:hypothetical protein Daus18300_006480 [Diaporthe australafricana]|uniref:Alpha and gamma adaptin binding protein p34 n=1 Tax=Diaporthe australafricana TaxID=127596 RepID=A0ABR3WTT2_9PEZI